jgi:hypothetical protein
MRFRIEYQYGTYSGTEIVEAEDSDIAIAKMWARFNRRGFLSLGMAYRSARAEEIGDDDGGEE